LVDEKSDVQAIDRSQPNRPLKGRAGTMINYHPDRIIAAVKRGRQC